MTVCDALASELHRQGTQAVFGLMGEDTAKLVVALRRLGIAYYGGRHESAGIGMADGYTRVSGDVGVSVISRGPGFTNCLTALKSASKAGSRLLVLVADSAIGVEDPAIGLAATRTSKYIDQSGILSAAGIVHVTLGSPATAVADLGAVFDHVREGVTVAVNLPVDVLAAEAGDDPAQVTLPAVERTSPDLKAISAAADLLETTWAAQRPVILAGRGAIKAEAGPELGRLGDTCGALLATTMLARSLFSGHPYDIGVSGTVATPLASELLREADVVLVFGASLNNLTTYAGDLFPKAKIIQFDADKAAFGRFMSPDLAVLGDVRLSATALAEELDRRGHRTGGYRTAEVARKIAAFDLAGTFGDKSRPGALDPRSLLLAVDGALPRERNVVVDTGHHMTFQASYLSVPNPRSWVWPLDFSAIGSATGVALGAAIASPGRLTVLGVGDGGLMMTLGELDTAIRYRVPLLVLVIDDAAYGAEVQHLQVAGLPDDAARFEERSFEWIARAIGADGVTVTSLADVAPLADRLQNLKGPLVVDCKITTEVQAAHVASWQALNRLKPVPSLPVTA